MLLFHFPIIRPLPILLKYLTFTDNVVDVVAVVVVVSSNCTVNSHVPTTDCGGVANTIIDTVNHTPPSSSTVATTTTTTDIKVS